MSNLMQLKHRIKSITTTRKVTHAMRLIAISFYNLVQKQNGPLIEYQKTVLDLLQKLYQAYPAWKNPLFVVHDHLNSTPLIIVISAAKGLCGSFHENLTTYFSHTFLPEEHQTIQFITVGLKATSYIKKQIEKEKNGVIVASFDEITLQNRHELAQKIFSLVFGTEQYSSVTVYNNTLQSFFSQKPSKQQLLPLINPTKSSSDEADQQEPTREYIWEQDKKSICDTLSETYLKSCIESILMQSLLSEQAARFMAMENATTSASKYISSLTLQYNKTRQDLVTKEITELSAAM